MKNSLEQLKSIIKEGFLKDVVPKDLLDELVEYADFRNELLKESDRGCALLAASHLDFLLTKMLKSKLLGSNKHLDSLFDNNGPLGTFSSKILMSFSLGLISKVELDDLQIIRKIRNEFGHSISIINFESDKFKGQCHNLQLVHGSQNNPRSKFITSVGFISGGLISETFKKKKFESVNEFNDEKLDQIKNLLNDIESHISFKV
ncbi:MltR family transcriptional regulator [Flectobacillus roseus]|uniref:MltR family transcriptional regulator n=1 Tax=Flectobacillus roseus TaxID=502259 RepID=UPI0024B6BF27|nr:MltR family transcriptional regulator [Flectobacillus roseus]MDI9867893.1 MltR family transcriptional regulator [Flectobacillus roseus]